MTEQTCTERDMAHVQRLLKWMEADMVAHPEEYTPEALAIRADALLIVDLDLEHLAKADIPARTRS